MPMIMIGTTWRSRLVVFSPEKKEGLMTPKTRIMTSNATVTEMTCPIPRMARNSFRCFLFMCFSFFSFFLLNGKLSRTTQDFVLSGFFGYQVPSDPAVAHHENPVT